MPRFLSKQRKAKFKVQWYLTSTVFTNVSMRIQLCFCFCKYSLHWHLIIKYWFCSFCKHASYIQDSINWLFRFGLIFPSDTVLLCMCLVSYKSYVKTLRYSLYGIWDVASPGITVPVGWVWNTKLLPGMWLALVSPYRLTGCETPSYFLGCGLPWYNRTGWLGVKHQVTSWDVARPGITIPVDWVWNTKLLPGMWLALV